MTCRHMLITHQGKLTRCRFYEEAVMARILDNDIEDHYWGTQGIKTGGLANRVGLEQFYNRQNKPGCMVNLSALLKFVITILGWFLSLGMLGFVAYLFYISIS